MRTNLIDRILLHQEECDEDHSLLAWIADVISEDRNLYHSNSELMIWARSGG